jgi:sugar-specific transcriptional regulator TrmB
MPADYVQLLKSIGLNESEAKVYITSLEIGAAPAHILVTRSGFSRPATYQAIDLLIEKGLLISVLRGKRNVYIAESPEKLASYGEIQLSNFEHRVNDLKRATEEMRLLQRGERPVVKFYEGLDGLKMILSDVGDTKPESTTEIVNVDALGKVFTKEELAGLQTYLSKLRSNGRALLAGDVRVVRKGVEARILPGKEYPFAGDFLAYGNKLAIVTYQGKLVGVVIESEVIADTFRTLFDFAWKGATEYPLMKGEGWPKEDFKQE